MSRILGIGKRNGATHEKALNLWHRWCHVRRVSWSVRLVFDHLLRYSRQSYHFQDGKLLQEAQSDGRIRKPNFSLLVLRWERKCTWRKSMMRFWLKSSILFQNFNRPRVFWMDCESNWILKRSATWSSQAFEDTLKIFSRLCCQIRFFYTNLKKEP